MLSKGRGARWMRAVEFSPVGPVEVRRGSKIGMKLRKGSHNATELKFGIVVAKFNKFVTSKLLSSCIEGLTKYGVKAGDIEVVRVPGAFEIPLVARTMAKSSRFNAVIC